MHPIFFSIGDFTVRWYGVLAALGFLSAILLVRANRRFAGLSVEQITNVVMLAMFSGVLGARIFYVAQNWRYYRNHWSAIIRIDQGGLVFYGGFMLAFLGIVWYVVRRCRADWVRVCDTMAPALAGAHALGRIGCFLNGCCFGKPAEICWAVVYPAGSEPFRRYGAAALHPVQLYEAGLNILLGIALFFLVRKTKRGVVMSCYILAYGLLRFLDEFFRGDHTDFVDGFTPAQVIGFGLIPLGAILLIWFATRRAPAVPPAVERS